MICQDKSIYTGITNDLKARFKKHRAGKGGHYTRSHTPIKIIYTERFKTKGKALKRESEIKLWNKKRKLNLIKRPS